jgi:flagellar hook-associated protein 1
MSSGLGLTAALGMSANALIAQRAAIEVTGHNIANVNTPGYSRQRARLLTEFPVRTSLGSQGQGVYARSIQQIRSALLDGQIPSGISNLAYHEEKSNLLQLVQAGIGQPLDQLVSQATATATDTPNGLVEQIDNFFNAWQSLSTNPSSPVLRQQLVAAAQSVAAKLNDIGDNLVNLQTQITTQASQTIDDLNLKLSEIADLNKQIASVEVGGLTPAPDLRDLRQVKIEELAQLIDIDAQEQNDGTVTIRLGNAAGTLLVSGVFSGNTASAATVKLATRSTDVPPNIDIEGWTGGVAEIDANLSATTQPNRGTLAAQLEAINTTIGSDTNGLILDFNNIAAAIADMINTQHALGFTLENPPAYDVAGTNTFFDDDANPANALGTVTARNIQLNSDVASDSKLIAASNTTAEPNNGTNARTIAQLRTSTTGLGLGGMTLANYYNTSVFTLGNEIRASDNLASTQQSVNEQLGQQRESISGVSIDEETSNLIRFQKAFEASARVFTTITEMLDTIISMAR